MDTMTFEQWYALLDEDITARQREWAAMRTIPHDDDRYRFFLTGAFDVDHVRVCVDVCLVVLRAIAGACQKMANNNREDVHVLMSRCLYAMADGSLLFPQYTPATRLYTIKFIAAAMDKNGPVPAEVES